MQLAPMAIGILSVSVIRSPTFDHIAFATRKLDNAIPFMVDCLGKEKAKADVKDEG
ncbi:hypothetical protein M1146_03965 [Patescibacteria group bacterium]|nr:hypothetical protein [Patescibacteria group bacterium]